MLNIQGLREEDGHNEVDALANGIVEKPTATKSTDF